MDIKRTANKNMLFYEKQIKEDLTKHKLFTTSKGMNTILEDIKKEFKYYRLSLFIYSFSTFVEVLLLRNFENNYLQSKTKELAELNAEYFNLYNQAFDYIKNNANKSLESNVLSGIGSAGETIGNLAEKVNVIKNKNVDAWFNEKGSNLKQIGHNIKENFSDDFAKLQESNSQPFINQIEKFDCIYNKTREIYFDNENIYLEYAK